MEMDRRRTVRINSIRPFPPVLMSVSQTFIVEGFASQNLFYLFVARRESAVVARRKTKHIFAVVSYVQRARTGLGLR